MTGTGASLEVRGLTLRFGPVVAFEDVGFSVSSGEVFAVIGPNGAGKTSLFNVLSRVYEPSSGQVRLGERDLLATRARELAACGVARTFQNLALFGELSVLDNVMIGRHHLMRSGVLGGGVWVGRARREEREHRAAALDCLAFVGARSHADTRTDLLPYGVRKRIELARALAMEPTLLLLDEPVAGMNDSEKEEITDLVQRVQRERGITVLLVEHDMGMVMTVAQRVLVLDFGRVITCDVPEVVQRDPEVIRAYLGEELSTT